MTSHLSVQVLRTRLDQLDLPSNGKKPELQRRLRKALAKIKAEEERIESGALRDEELDPTKWTPKFTDYLVVDVEATCEDGKMGGFGYPNEIIELPVLLLRLSSSDSINLEPQLVATFHTFVRPIFQPTLTPFCKTLTGITQAQVDSAPTFPEALSLLFEFLRKHDLLDHTSHISLPSTSGRPAAANPFLDPFSAEHRSSLKRNVLFCSHGPFDIRDFVPKACWMNAFTYGPPVWLRKCSILDARKAVLGLVYVGKVNEGVGKGGKVAPVAKEEHIPPDFDLEENEKSTIADDILSSSSSAGRRPRHIDSTIPGLLLLLHLDPFEGQLHSGLDDTRNLARVVCELVRRVTAGARSWSDESRWDEVEEEEAAASVTLQQEEHNVLDGLSKAALNDTDVPTTGLTGSESVPIPATPLPCRRRPPPPTPLAPHIRDQLLAPNVYLPEYPPPPPPLLPTQSRSDSLMSKSSCLITASHLLPPARSNGPPRLIVDDLSGAAGEADFSGDEGTAHRLLKGGSIYYPKRWAWMGKKEGMVKWDQVVQAEVSERCKGRGGGLRGRGAAGSGSRDENGSGRDREMESVVFI